MEFRGVTTVSVPLRAGRAVTWTAVGVVFALAVVLGALTGNFWALFAFVPMGFAFRRSAAARSTSSLRDVSMSISADEGDAITLVMRGARLIGTDYCDQVYRFGSADVQKATPNLEGRRGQFSLHIATMTSSYVRSGLEQGAHEITDEEIQFRVDSETEGRLRDFFAALGIAMAD